MKFDFKQLLQGVKKNWAIPTLSIVTVGILGATWWFSSSWNSQIKSESEKAANDLLSQVNNLKVTYALPTIGTGQAVEQKSEPNSVLTQKYAERKKALLSSGEAVVKAAEAFNVAGKTPLVEGLFPEPKANEQLSKPLDFVARLVGSAERGQPSAYVQLLNDIGAGNPVSASALEAQLKDIEKREIEKIRGSSPTRELTATEKESLQKTLIESRKGEYVRKAGEVRVYADMSAFPGGSTAPAAGPGGFGAGTATTMGGILLSAPSTPLSVNQAFVYQSDLWFLKDLFAIIRNANAGPGGRTLPVRDAVVKRIDKIELLPWRVQTAAVSAAAAAPGGAPVDPNAAVATSAAESITGFSDTAEANTYDIRRAKLTLVVSSAKLPQFFDAVARTNFMTVTGIAMEKVDSWADLANGYYYGDENVVRVLVDIETIWLRSWTEQYFPRALRAALGLPDLPDPNAKPAEGQPAEGQTPPPGGG